MPSQSKKQHNLMAMVANNPAAAKRTGIPKSVGEEYMKADKGRKFGSGGMKAKLGNPQTRRGKMQLPNSKIPKFAGGGDIDPTKLEDEANESAARERDIMESASAVPSMPKESFKEAFANAKDGSTFSWNGKQYKKEYAKPKAPAPKAETPKAAAPKAAAPKASTPAPRAATPAPRAAAPTPTPTPPRASAAGPRSAGPRPTNSDETNRIIANTALENVRRMTRQREEAAMTPEQRYQRTVGENVAAYGRRQQAAASPNMEAAKRFSLLAGQGGPMAEYYAEQARKFAGEGAAYAKGGSVESKKMMKKEIGFMKAKGAPKSMIKHEEAEAKGMKGGGSCGGMKKYARGGGVESKGKTKGTMIRMASGGSVSARADGIASKGKTNCKIC